MTVKTFNSIAAANVKTFNGVAAANLKTWNGQAWPAAGGFPFANVKALLHFNGADASTTFTDVIGHTFTAFGDAQIDTAQQKWGTASGLFDGTGDYVSTPDHADFTLGTNSFTIEFWVRFNSISNDQYLAGQCDSSTTATSCSFIFWKTNTNGMYFRAWSGSTLIVSIAVSGTGTAVATGQWYHIAAVRNGNVFTIYQDGVGYGTITTASSINDSANKLSIGRAGEYPALYLNGWIDDFRLVNGSAVYTGNFTPPAAEFPDS